MPETKYMTVVFEYEDGAALPLELTAAFKGERSAYKDTTITAISFEDEISRVEQLENMDVSELEKAPGWAGDDAVYVDGAPVMMGRQPSEELQKLWAKARSVPSKS
ncbi:hypothetical protein [Teredinibacter purpureus]|uniref:hypothetical protein n=1 Tax=Teredinibacter purpureus TaxID=2731756 RepID=UPI0005F81143|nr:hypothetical protein [Teredinibacter purpureus]